MKCYVLNGGLSRRMGVPKWELRLEGSTFLERVMAAALPVFDEVIMIASAEWAGVTPGRVIVEEPREVRSPLFGMREAFRDCADSRIWILGVDFPLISSSVLRFLSSAFERSEAEVLVPIELGHRQVLCAGYSMSVAKSVDRLLESGDFRVQNLLHFHSHEEIAEHDMLRHFPERPLRNVNHPTEYAQLRSVHG